jgi:RNA polymerase sigma-70 factor (ECF subfamily)
LRVKWSKLAEQCRVAEICYQIITILSEYFAWNNCIKPRGLPVVDFKTLTDEELMLQVQAGNHNAFAVLVKRHLDRFYGIAYRMTSNRATAEDIVQDSFLRLWERPNLWQARKKVKFTTWFYRVIVNRCINFYKSAKPVELLEDVVSIDNGLIQDKKMLLDERQLALEKAISALPPRQKAALNLCFYEGLSHQKAANIIGVRLKALQSLLMRAKENLRTKLSDYL